MLIYSSIRGVWAWNLCLIQTGCLTETHTLVPSADLCMGWVPPGGLGHPGTAAAPRAAGVWAAPAGRPEHPGSSWRWCSKPRSIAGVTLSGVSQVEWRWRGKRDKNSNLVAFQMSSILLVACWCVAHQGLMWCLSHFLFWNPAALLKFFEKET